MRTISLKKVSCALLLSTGICLSSLAVKAQKFEPLRPAGELNTDFTRPAHAQYKSKSISKQKGNREQKQERSDLNDLALYLAVYNEHQYRSGEVFSGDWLSVLVDSLGRQLSAAAGFRPDEVRFYVLASNEVNAYATVNKTIFLTTGLLARIRSEAELAFVMAHELGHIEHNHGVERYKKAMKLARSLVNSRGRKEFEEDPYSISRYSRGQELEADSFGLAQFAKSEYPGFSVDSLFECLRYSYLSDLEYGFHPKELNVYDIQPVDELYLAEFVEPNMIRKNREEKERKAREKAEAEAKKSRGRGRNAKQQVEATVVVEESEPTEDELEKNNPSSHPAIDLRKEKAQQRLANKEGKEYLWLSPEDVSRVRRQASYEVVNQHLRYDNYIEALYEAVTLLRNDPQADTVFLQKAITQSILYLTVLRKNYEEAWEDRLKEIKNITAVRVREKAMKEYEERNAYSDASYGFGELQRVYHLFGEADLEFLSNLALGHAVRYEIMNPESASAQIFTDRALEQLHSMDGKGLSKWERAYPEAAAAAERAGLKLEKRWRDAKDFSDLESYTKATKSMIEDNRKGNTSLGIKSIVVALPVFYDNGYQLNEATLKRNHEESSKQVELIKTTMKSTGVKGEVISDMLGKKSAEDLEKIRAIKEYLKQFSWMESRRLIPHNYDRVLEILQESKTDKLLFIEEGNEKSSFMAHKGNFILGFGLISPYSAIASLFAGHTSSNFTTLIIDVKERRSLMFERYTFEGRQQRALQQGHYYSLFHQVQRKK